MWNWRLFEWFRTTRRLRAPVAQGAQPPPEYPVFIRADTHGPLRQSEILTGVIQRRRSFRSLNEPEGELQDITHPFAIVVTQDCDLEQDFRCRNEASSTPSDKLLPDILLAQVVTAKELFRRVDSDIRRRAKANKDERYHLLQQIDTAMDAEGEGIPALGVDFKRYFTVPADELYAQLSMSARRRAYLNTNYLEHFATRFAYYLSRVALPKDHQIEY